MLTRMIGGYIGVVLAVAAVAVVILFVLDSDDGEDVVRGVGFHPFTSDPGNDDCAGAADALREAPNDCDPINLVFEGVPLDVAVTALREAGWVTIGLGSTQWLSLDDADGLVAHAEQLFFVDSLDARLHLRLWSAPAVAGEAVLVGAVHHEQGILTHRIDQDWEAAEARVRVMEEQLRWSPGRRV